MNTLLSIFTKNKSKIQNKMQEEFSKRNSKADPKAIQLDFIFYRGEV